MRRVPGPPSLREGWEGAHGEKVEDLWGLGVGEQATAEVPDRTVWRPGAVSKAGRCRDAGKHEALARGWLRWRRRGLLTG